MSATSSTVDQDAIRVANRYAGQVEKAVTLQERARACQDAVDKYRADARANVESAENHRAAARTIRDVSLARQHAMAARDAEAEAAREILAARYYEQQAEQYQAQAHGITPAGAGAGGLVLDDRREAAGHYDGARGRTPQDTVKEAMTASAGTTGPVDTGDGGALPDAAGLAGTGSEHWHGSDVVTAGSGNGTVSLGLCQFPDSDAYVVVATNPADKPWDPDADGTGIDPALSKKEAGQLADTLEELAALAESGAQTTAPTRLEKLAARVRDLIGTTGVTIAGDDGQIEVSAADMRKILDAAAPEPAVPARRKVDAKACLKDNMDTGAVWAELDASGSEPVITVTTTEGEPPENCPGDYTTTRLSPAEARQLADKVRRFATTDPQAESAPQPVSMAPPAAAPVPEPATAAEPVQARRVTNSRGKTYEYDPATGATAVIEADGWRAVVPAGSSTGLAARLLYWRAEIKDGRGQDATGTAARALLARLTLAEVREVAEAIGTSASSARTKSHLIDTVVNTAIDAPRKYRGLSTW